MVRIFPRPKTWWQSPLFFSLKLVIISVALDVAIFLIWSVFLGGPPLPSIAKQVDVPLGVTLVLVEVPISVFLWMMFERNRNRLQDAVTTSHALTEFSHLEVVKATPWKLYVINTRMKMAYTAPKFILDLWEAGIVREPKKFKEIWEITEYFRERKITLVDRNPSQAELYDALPIKEGV